MRCWFRCRLRCGAGTGGGGGRRGGFFLCYRGLRGFLFERRGGLRDVRLVYVALHCDPCCVYFLLCSRGRLYELYVNTEDENKEKTPTFQKGEYLFPRLLDF